MSHSGKLSQEIIDQLLQNLRKTREYRSLGVAPSKRVYSIIVECLENMLKHTPEGTGHFNGRKPYISAGDCDSFISISSGNPVSHLKKELLASRLEKINGMSMEELAATWEHILNRETRLSDNGAGAGLGFILMKLRSGGNINFSFTGIDENYSFFEIQISVKKHTMRKLIIDKTVNSPGVIFDPENERFEISGESRPSDVASFYLELLKWFDDYSSYLGQQGKQDDTVFFNFDFEYFNSSSAKYILDFCKQIGDARSKGRNLAIRWHYDKDDLDMLQVGQEMSKISRMPFEYAEKNFD